FLEPLKRHPIFPQIDSLIFAEFVGQIIDNPLVEVLTTKEGIAVGGLDLEDAVADLEDRYIEGSAAKVEDRDLFVLLLVEPISQRSGRGLVDDSKNAQSSNSARVLGRLAACDLPNQTFPRFSERDHRRRRAGTFRVGDDDGIATFHHRDATVGRTKIYSDYFGHCKRKPRSKTVTTV